MHIILRKKDKKIPFHQCSLKCNTMQLQGGVPLLLHHRETMKASEWELKCFHFVAPMHTYAINLDAFNFRNKVTERRRVDPHEKKKRKKGKKKKIKGWERHTKGGSTNNTYFHTKKNK